MLTFGTSLVALSTTMFGLVRADLPENSTQTFLSASNVSNPIFGFEKTGTTAPGSIFWVDEPSNAAVIATQDGDLVWYHHTESDHIVNLTPQILFGQPVLTWNRLVYQNLAMVIAYGFVEILDDTYTSIYNVTLPDTTINDQVPGHWSTKIDSHEAWISPQGTMFVLAYNSTPWDLRPVGGPQHGWLRDCLAYEIDVASNEVLWKWRASDDIGIEWSRVSLNNSKMGAGTSSAQAWDYFHINSVRRFEDGVIVSSRHCHLGVFVDYASVKTRWVLQGQDGGDFVLEQPDAFAFQHDIHLARDPHTGGLVMTVFSNDNASPAGDRPSKGVMLDLDLDAKTARVRQTFHDPERPLATYFGASMAWDQSNQRVFLDYGSKPVVQEFDMHGSMVYQMDINTEGRGTSYRAYKAEWKGFPMTRPSVNACATGNAEVDVYMSWNGATEVRAWNVYTGAEAASELLQSTTSVERSGFETKATISGDGVGFVQVEAVGGRNPGDTWRSRVVQVGGC